MISGGEALTMVTIDMTTDKGVRRYLRTLEFVLIKAVLDLYPEAKITIEHSLSKGIFGEIYKNTPLTEYEVEKIKIKMQDLVDKDLPIKKVIIKREEAIKIFNEYGMFDKVRLLNQISLEYVNIYELEGRFDYFYGGMAESTGILKLFEVSYYEPGFLLKYPTVSSPNVIPEFIDHKKLANIFYETEQWGNILHAGDVGLLNEKIESGEMSDFIKVVEALHEKKIAYIADMVSDKKSLKLVLIAGPSSSGKTTFSKRLGIQLRVNGLIPVPISLDDYFLNREYSPRDEFGNYDFESINALDLELFNLHLGKLLNGESVNLPKFNFKTGCREWSNEEISLPQSGIIIIEGIHGLNEKLTSSINSENKFKIYISALTQLNLDDHNRIATTDLRILRRIVRDSLTRGYSAEDTLKMFPSVKRGEEKNIFVFQEESDVMFNSALVYELCVLKKFAFEELDKIKEDSNEYYEANRLKSFLKFFKEVDTKLVPENSILREFIGGSCFYKY